MKNYIWKDINDLFDAINKKCNYVILRNYEEISNSNFYYTGHADIDFLTDNVSLFVKTIRGYPRFVKDDFIHYFININGIEVQVDVRHVGDDYYCKKWEREMLSSKVLYNNFYVLNEINYYYSLIYHAILQKSCFSNDYKERLRLMANNLNINAYSEKEQLHELTQFMINKEYFFCFPDDYCVLLRTMLIPSKMVKKHYKIRMRKIKWCFLGFLSKTKKRIYK